MSQKLSSMFANSRRLRGHNRRFIVQGPGAQFTLGAVDLEDARSYVDSMDNEEWRLWRFCGGDITIREMSSQEIAEDNIKSMFNS